MKGAAAAAALDDSMSQALRSLLQERPRDAGLKSLGIMYL